MAQTGWVGYGRAYDDGMSRSRRKQTFLEIADKKEGDEVYFRARVQSVRHQSEASLARLAICSC